MRRLMLMLTFNVAAMASARSQELRGTVTLADGFTHASGVIVEATDPSTGSLVARTLSGSEGQFSLRLPSAGTVSLHGLRIGQRPSEFGSFTLAVGEVRNVRFTLLGAVIVLDQIRITGESVCGRMTAEASQVATLLDEARKALRSTQLAGSSGRMTAEWVVENRLESLRGVPLTDPTVRRFRASTDRPFASLSPDSLAKVGYLSTQGETWIYQAPDAVVLLSEQFVSGHCFRAVPSAVAAEEFVGIAFQPAPRRDQRLVGIRGTLWVDRRSAELRRLDYEYVDVPRELAGTPAGGRVEFLRLASGDWLVDRWEIRMPRPTMHEDANYAGGSLRRSLSRRTMRITSMEVASGRVQEVRRGGALLYAAFVEERPATLGRRAEAVASLCDAAVRADRGLVWGVVRDSTGAPVSGVAVQVDWEHGHRYFAPWARTWETSRAEATTEADGFWFACDVPRANYARATAMRGAVRGPVTEFVIPSDSLGLEVAVALAGARRVTDGVVVRGVVVDSLRTGGPWAGAEVRVLGTALRATTDTLGRFEIADVPRGAHALSVSDPGMVALSVPAPTREIRIGRDWAGAGVALASPSIASHFRQRCGREIETGEGILIGEVRDVSGVRRAGVQVRGGWARLLLAAGVAERDVRHVTDTSAADGTFVLCGVPLAGDLANEGGVSALMTGEVTLSAAGIAVSAGPVTAQLDGSALVRRDLIVGGAQRVRVGGRVVDELGRPVPEATVLLVGAESRNTRTDSTGAWTLDSVPLRSVELMIRALRFLPRRHQIDPLSGRMSVGDVRLQRAPAVLAERRISATAFSRSRVEFEDRRKSGLGTFLDEGWIARMPRVTSTNVRAMIAKSRLVREDSVPNGIARMKIAFETDAKPRSAMGSGIAPMSTCFPRWYIDGVDFGVPSGAEEELFLMQAKRIEAYRALEMPARYVDFDGCGVILIWTYDF